MEKGRFAEAEVIKYILDNHMNSGVELTMS